MKLNKTVTLALLLRTCSVQLKLCSKRTKTLFHCQKTNSIYYLKMLWALLTPLTIVKDYSNDIPAVIKMLNDIHSVLNDRVIKGRVTRLKKKLLKHIPESDTSDSESSMETI